MSTKIYDGMRLAEGLNPFEVIPKLREKLEATVLEGSVHALGRILQYHQSDVERQGLVESASAPWWTAQAQQDRDNEEFAEIMFGWDPIERRHLVLPYGGRRIADALHQMEEFEDYSYWDNSDSPENITAEQWKRRAVAWNALLAYEAPADRMLGFKIDGRRLLSRASTHDIWVALEPSLASLKDRSIHHVTQLLLTAISVSSTTDTEKLMERLHWARDTARSSDAEQLVDLITSYLPPFSMELFFKPTPGDLHMHLPALMPKIEGLASGY